MLRGIAESAHPGRPTSRAQLTAMMPSTVGNRQPLAGSHRFWVHGSPSSHTSGADAAHTPAVQTSSPLQALPSEHGVPSGNGVPATQPLPGTSVSTPLQGLPSLHASAAAANASTRPAPAASSNPVIPMSTALDRR